MVNLPYSLYEAICDRNKHAYSDIDRTMLGKVNIKMGSPVVGIYNTCLLYTSNEFLKDYETRS